MAGLGKSVLLLGSGLCSHPIIEYLDRHGYVVHVASRTPNATKMLNAPHAKMLQLDVETAQGEAALAALAPQVDALVSLLPYTFHPKVAAAALAARKHFLCSSYVSDGLRALAPAFKAAGLVMGCELGVDPGTDHMTAMQIIHRVHAEGGRLTYFTSFAGGLPAPEHNDNPFGYKFSWAPRGVLLAGKNSASFYRDGRDETIKSEDLFRSFWTFDVAPFAQFEVYPNRDSRQYREIYGIPEVQTLIRGTLRNKGWWCVLAVQGGGAPVSLCGVGSEKIKKLVDLGYVDETVRSLAGKSYGQLTLELSHGTDASSVAAHVAAVLKVPVDSHVIKAFEWLGLFDFSLPIPSNVPQTHLDVLCDLMRHKMTLQPHERDLMVLRHTMKAEFDDGRVEHILSTLVDFGTVHGDTSMARTTSLPLAIATRLVLEGRFTEPGLQIPVIKELYEPILAELKVLGIEYKEQITTTHVPHLWVRAEVKPGEHRAPITPATAQSLVKSGLRVTVEKCAQRCFRIDDYASAGCTIVESGTWPQAPKHCFIVGLKELPADNSALVHRHIFFCHAYKNQAGWKETLARFTRGHGALYDMEYLTWPDGRRVAAFGRVAGMAGAALGALIYACKLAGKPLPPLQPWPSQLHMVAHIKGVLGDRTPTAFILGALGRSGRGAADVLEALGFRCTKWDLAEVRGNPGPYPVIAEHDVFVNCVLLTDPVPPFLTSAMLEACKLSVIVDVSCDTSNPANPLPMCNRTTTITDPVLRINEHVSAVTIDHLPTLLPVEASEGFSHDLAPHLVTLPDGDVWTRALALFQAKSAAAQ